MRVPSSIQQALPEPQSKLKTFDLSSFLEEVALGRINVNSIQNGLLRVTASLKAGKYLFPGKYEDAHVMVKENTQACLTIKLGKDPNSKTVMTQISISMNHKIRVTNPSSAYEEPGCSNGLKDLLADLCIKGIEVGSGGEILFQGDLKKGFCRSDIKEAFKPELFPKIDLKLESLLNKKKEKESPPPADGFVPKISLVEMLDKLGAIMGKAQCSIRLHTDAPVVSIPHAEIELEPSSPGADLHLDLSTRLRPGGRIEINSDDRFDNVLELAHSNLKLGVHVVVSGLADKKPKVDGSLSGLWYVDQSSEFVLRIGDKTRIPFSVGGKYNRARLRFDLKQNNPKNAKLDYFLQGHLAESTPIQLGDNRVQFEEAKLQLLGAYSRNRAKLTVVKPRLSFGSLYTQFNGKMELELDPNSVTYRFLSREFRPFERRVNYEFFPGPELSLRPANSGVSQFLDPENQFVWEPKLIANPSGPSLGELGSAEWRLQIERITGAPIRAGNHVKLLIDGKMSFAERMKLIREAKHSIYLQTLIWRDDETGMATAQAVVDAKQRGVDVCVLVDAVGSLEKVEDLLRENKVYQLLQKNGIEFKLYGNQSMQGLGKIAEVVVRNPTLQGFQGIGDLLNPETTLSTCNLLARIALGDLGLGLSEEDREQIQTGLKLILGEDARATAMVERLAHVDASQPLETFEIIQLFERVLGLRRRLHEKYLVVDGKMISGGMNIADEYFKGGLDERVPVAGVSRPAWRDTDILVEGPAARDAAVYIARNWKSLGGKDLKIPSGNFNEDGVDVQVIQSRPGMDPVHPITNFKIEAIKSLKAGDRLWEASAYFIPEGALKSYAQALMLAAERGVDVRILTNSEESTDLPLVNQAALATCYPELLAAGVRIFERTGERTMHQKTAVYGSKLSMIGSNNLSNGSGSLNTEDAVVVYSEDFTKKMESMLLEDMSPAVAREVLPNQVKSFPIKTAIKNSIMAMLKDQM